MSKVLTPSGEYPTLKFPKGQTLLTARIAREHPNGGKGFAGACYKAMEKAEALEAELLIRSLSRGNPSTGKIAINVNSAFQRIRNEVSAAAQEYLLAHDGIVDVWPDSSGQHVLQLTKTNMSEEKETEKARRSGAALFDYFGGDYDDTDSEWLGRKDSKLVYRNGYRQRLTGDWSAATNQAMLLRDQMEQAQKERKSAACLGALLGGIYFIFAALCVLACAFFGLGGTFFELYNTQTARVRSLGMILFLPGLLCTAIEALSGAAYWFLTGALLLVCVLGAAVCLYFYAALNVKSREARKAAKAYRDYVRTDAYREAERREKEARARDSAFAEEWQRAWYDWIRSVRQWTEDA